MGSVVNHIFSFRGELVPSDPLEVGVGMGYILGGSGSQTVSSLITPVNKKNECAH